MATPGRKSGTGAISEELALKQSIQWQIAQVKAIRQETPTVKTFTLTIPDWVQHRSGQHYDIRLTAPDGYQAQRSYSIASEPERQSEIDLTVERLDEGEVSPYMHDVLIPGDQIELRGPLGGYFAWDTTIGGPLLLIGGGSGVVPLMAMIRHRKAQHSDIRTRLLYSVRTPDDVIYGDELNRLTEQDSQLEVIYTFTRQVPTNWKGYSRRIDERMLREVLQPLGGNARIYICGPTALVEVAANTLASIGIAVASIRTERFGPTGGD
jgi:ferredoxin-NADP reductase